MACRVFNFEKVDIAEIPPSSWGINYWRRPAMAAFLEQLDSLPDNQALVTSYPNRRESLAAHQALRQRIKRALELNLLRVNYAITGRTNGDGTVNLYIFKER